MGRIPAGSFASVIRAYMASELKTKAKATQQNYSRALALAELPETLGALSVEVIRPALVQAFLDGLSDRPGKQSVARTALKAVEKWALVRDLLPFPIMTGTYCVGSDGGHEPWPDTLVAVAELHARPDLSRVVTLAVETGQRGSDVIRMRPNDIEEQDGHRGLNVIQQKTKRRLWIPLTNRLAEVIESWERRPAPFVLRPDGTPYTRENTMAVAWYRERANNASLASLEAAGLVMHGLRATAVVRARRRGATVLQISSMFGMSEQMVARYSRLADQRENALAAVHHLNRTSGERAQVTIKKTSG